MHHEMPHKAYREYANALLESSRFVWLKLPFMKSQFPYVIYMCVCTYVDSPKPYNNNNVQPNRIRNSEQ
jgi:hypothetical protein